MKQFKIVFGLVLFFTLFILSGCGASGGGGTGVPAPSPGGATVPAMISFSINGSAGVITSNRISVTLPFGTDVTSLVPTFRAYGVVTVGGTLQQSGKTAQNFTAPIIYTVATSNGIKVNYTVTVIVAASSAKAITAFSLATSSLATATPGVISILNITLTVPFGTNITSLIATFTTSGKNVTVNGVTQINGATPNDFTNPVVYTVTAADGTTQNYRVTVAVAASPANDFVGFSLNGTPGVISIGGLNSTISVRLPFGTNLNGLIASFITTGASVTVNGVTQVSGETQNDFTNPVTYIVTAADGTIQTYIVTASVALSSSNFISQFSFGTITGVINGQNIAVTVPAGTSVGALIATYTTTGVDVTVSGKSQTSTMTPNDFTNPVVYTVIAADGTTQSYTVTVTVALMSAKDITAFSFGTVNGTISGQSIVVIMPFGTDLTSLDATFSTTGIRVAVGTITQNSGSTINDFTNPVVYTVTAADGTTQNYTVSVAVASSSAKAITAFSLNGTSGVISGFNINVTVPNGNDITTLIATFTTTGTNVAIGGVTQISGATPANNFTTPVVYTVTAANGTTQNYTVTVTTMGQTGQLSYLSTPSIPAAQPGDVIMSPNGNFLYATSGANNLITMYSIDSTSGQLSLLSPSTVDAGINPFTIAITPNGKFAYVSNATGGNSITQFSVNTTTGQLSHLSPSTFATPGLPNGITISSDGRFAYVAIIDMNQILQYSIDATNGQLTLLPALTASTDGSPRRIAISSNGRFAYVSNATGNSVSQYSVDPTSGQFLPLTPASIATGPTPFGITLSPNGKFAYVNNSTGSSVSQYSVNTTTGLLSSLSTPTVMVGSNPRKIAITPNGSFLYVTNNASSTISEFSIDPSGLLIPLPTPTITVTNPLGISVSINGGFVYVGNNVGTTLSQFKVN